MATPANAPITKRHQGISRQTAPAFRPHALDEESTTPATTAFVVITRGPNTGSRFPLGQPTTSVGRHPHSDIFLDDTTVSRRHAEFRADHTGVAVVDVGSLSGTHVNCAPVEAITLTDGDEIQIGKFRLAFSTAPRTR